MMVVYLFPESISSYGETEINSFRELEYNELAKKIKFLNKNIGGWDAKKMKVSNNFLPDNNWYNKELITL